MTVLLALAMAVQYMRQEGSEFDDDLSDAFTLIVQKINKHFGYIPD